MKKHLYQRIPLLLLLLLIFACSKDLQKTQTATNDKLEKSYFHFYNRESIPIDAEVLSSLRKDTLFNEYVHLLDYSYISHLTDSLRKATSSQEEFKTTYLKMMKERAGTIPERFNKVKDIYPKDFFSYVMHENSLKKKNKTRMDDINIDHIYVYGLDEIYDQMARRYNEIWSAVSQLAYQSWYLYYSKIEHCNHSYCGSEVRLLTTTIDVVFMPMGGVGGQPAGFIQGFSDNFTHSISGSYIKTIVERYNMRFNQTLSEFNRDADYNIGLFVGALAWHPYFELAFTEEMKCLEPWTGGGGSSGGGGTGGGTTQPPKPEEKCNDTKCNKCGGCLNPTKSNCNLCRCVCEHEICQSCGEYIRIPQTRSSILPTICADHQYCKSNEVVCECGERHWDTERKFPGCKNNGIFVLYLNNKEGYSEMWNNSVRMKQEYRGTFCTINLEITGDTGGLNGNIITPNREYLIAQYNYNDNTYTSSKLYKWECKNTGYTYIQFQDAKSKRVIAYNPIFGVHTHPTMKEDGSGLLVNKSKMETIGENKYLEYFYLGISPTDIINGVEKYGKEYILNDGYVFEVNDPTLDFHPLFNMITYTGKAKVIDTF